MRNLITAILCLSLTALAGAQGSSSSASAQQANPEKSAQGTATQPKEPTAIIETTAGNITCTLFPAQAPLTVANFIGLATGTKAWKNPKTGEMMHGVPLYNGTIFHRVIPNFMIQGGDPAGNGTGGPATGSRMSSAPISPSTSPDAWRWPIAAPAPTARNSSSPKSPRHGLTVSTPSSGNAKISTW